MKTPECWHTSRDLRCKVPLPQSPFAMMDWHTQTNGSDSIVLTAYYICIRWHDFMHAHANVAHVWNSCHYLFTRCSDCAQMPKLNLQKSSFFWPGDLDLWPMTLAIELGLDIIKVHPHTIFMSVCQTVQPWECSLTDRNTETWTDKTDSITSTAAAGGKNWILCSFLHETVPRF